MSTCGVDWKELVSIIVTKKDTACKALELRGSHEYVHDR